MNKNTRICSLVFGFFLLSAYVLLAQENNISQRTFSLDDCISEALKKHPKLNIYERKSEQQKERLRAVIAENLPQVDAMVSYDKLSYVPQSKQLYLGDSYNDYQANIVVTQPLFTGGRVTSERNATQYAIDAEEQSYLAAREDVIFNVKYSYYKLLFARNILKSKEDLLKYADLFYDTAFDLNKRTKFPREETLLRLEVQLNEVKQELIAAEDNLKIAEKSLLNAMGLNSNNAIQVLDMQDEVVFSEDTPVEIANNPEILKTSYEVKEADELIKVAKSGFYPQVSARYSYGYEWAQLPASEYEWIAGVKIDIPIWDWGKTRADVRRSEAYVAELKAYEDLLTQEFELELESAQLKYESAVKRLEIARISLGKARKSLNLFGDRYRDTLATSIELLDAQKAFSQAQVNYALSLLDIRLAKAEIEKLTGRGYDFK